MAIFDNLGGGSKPNVFYTDELDKVQIRTKDGNVHDWKDGGLQATYIYNQGVINTDVVSDIVNATDGDSSITDKNITFEDTYILTGITGGNTSSTFITENAIDVNKYKVLGVSILEGVLERIIELDISTISGSYHAGIRHIQNGSNQISSWLFLSSVNSSIAPGKMEIYNKFNDAAAKTSNNQNLHITKLWLK